MNGDNEKRLGNQRGTAWAQCWRQARTIIPCGELLSAPADYARPTTITRGLPRGHRTPCIRIDMVDPVRASTMPQLGQAELLVLARSGVLASYDLGGQIRFRYRDAASRASRRAITA